MQYVSHIGTRLLRPRCYSHVASTFIDRIQWHLDSLPLGPTVARRVLEKLSNLKKLYSRTRNGLPMLKCSCRPRYVAITDYSKYMYSEELLFLWLDARLRFRQFSIEQLTRKKKVDPSYKESQFECNHPESMDYGNCIRLSRFGPSAVNKEVAFRFTPLLQDRSSILSECIISNP